MLTAVPKRALNEHHMITVPYFRDHRAGTAPHKQGVFHWLMNSAPFAYNTSHITPTCL